MDKITGSGVTILSDATVSRIELVKSINPNNSVVVFSAHGTEQSVIKYAEKHHYTYYDLTCKYVSNNYQIVKRLEDKSNIIFYGKRNHPETLAIKSLNKDILLIEDIKQNIKLGSKKHYTLINQTTIPQEFVMSLFKKLKQHTNNLKMIATTCVATQKRYKNIDLLKAHNTLIVIGDRHSNNTMLLVKLAQAKKLNVILLENDKQISDCDFTKIKRLYLTSGTSASQKTVNKIYKRLQLI
jgi:4-hydroxy-3-methylbut-2-enyl diphosphate reductase